MSSGNALRLIRHEPGEDADFTVLYACHVWSARVMPRASGGVGHRRPLLSVIFGYEDDPATAKTKHVVHN